jgi:hypothetical protein
VCNVDAEAGNAAVEPEPENVVDFVANVVVPPVQIGLVAEEVVQVILTAALVEFPRPFTAEHAHPVVRRGSIVLWIRPYVVVAVSRSAPGQRILKPGMLIARVVGNEVVEDPDPPR